MIDYRGYIRLVDFGFAKKVSELSCFLLYCYFLPKSFLLYWYSLSGYFLPNFSYCLPVFFFEIYRTLLQFLTEVSLETSRSYCIGILFRVFLTDFFLRLTCILVWTCSYSTTISYWSRSTLYWYFLLIIRAGISYWNFSCRYFFLFFVGQISKDQLSSCFVLILSLLYCRFSLNSFLLYWKCLLIFLTGIFYWICFPVFLPFTSM
jgi:hypothetical protein